VFSRLLKLRQEGVQLRVETPALLELEEKTNCVLAWMNLSRTLIKIYKKAVDASDIKGQKELVAEADIGGLNLIGETEEDFEML